MAANSISVADSADGDFEDWFEIYNPGPAAADLGGCWLTDDLAVPRKFQIPTNGNYVIAPGGFLIVWADNEPAQNSPANPELHVPFQLRAAGESIGLFAPNGITVVDSVTFAAQTNDVSEGRIPDSAADLRFLFDATPGRSNVFTEPVSLQVVISTDTDGSVAMAFPAISGRRYQLFYKESLDEPNWLPLGLPVQATGDHLTVSDSARSRPQRFYRVLQLE